MRCRPFFVNVFALFVALVAAPLPWQQSSSSNKKSESSWGNAARGAARALATEVISQALADNTVVIFSRTACSASNKVKAYFEDAGIPYYALELDTRADGDALSGALAEEHGAKTLTGGVSTPAVFIRGQSVDGSDIGRAAKSGELSHWTDS